MESLFATDLAGAASRVKRYRGGAVKFVERGSDMESLLAGLHPALVGAAWRPGRVGGREAAATLLAAIESGHVSVTHSAGGEILEFRLAGSLARSGGRALRSAHVQGLTALDRSFLVTLFAGSSATTLGELRADSGEGRRVRTHLLEWRQLVEREAATMQLVGRGRTISHHTLATVREALRDTLDEADGSGASLEPRSAELAVVFGLERQLHEALDAVPMSEAATRAAGVRLACGSAAGRSSAIAALVRALSPRHPSAPPVRIGVTVPLHQMPRVVDDGRTRLGG